ncbi:hypothetical protein LO763_19490 [Glycomyces sp. A-F 0318]|uniref:hypothetical protein n=1 Tax=Glycomyces amatae TaxID=2881355 RepID=UPI001E417405|nr:hypothetical protein [Glycomyces amatae]MCD0445795.1 hypothetical protein [Glycomyces amatae]
MSAGDMEGFGGALSNLDILKNTWELVSDGMLAYATTRMGRRSSAPAYGSTTDERSPSSRSMTLVRGSVPSSTRVRSSMPFATSSASNPP